MFCMSFNDLKEKNIMQSNIFYFFLFLISFIFSLDEQIFNLYNIFSLIYLFSIIVISYYFYNFFNLNILNIIKFFIFIFFISSLTNLFEFKLDVLIFVVGSQICLILLILRMKTFQDHTW